VPVLKQMLEVYEQYKTSVVAVERINSEDTVEYGVIESKEISRRTYQVLSLVEKPEPVEAPSNLGIVGRYILTPQIFNALKVTQPGTNQEIQLTDALQLLLKKQAIYACEFEGVRYDTGTPLGWLKATVAFALKHPDLGQELKKYLRQFL
jgi:UTP--glucose-1-phosphate uridylyltransferase